MANAAREAQHSPFSLFFQGIFVSCRQKFQRKRLAFAFGNADPRVVIIAIEARFGRGLRATQATGLSNKTWKPDAANFTATRSSIDSFMTAGAYSGGQYGGEYYASTNTNGDPNFSGTSWNATPASGAATTIPANAGWYTGDPTSVDNNAEALAGLVGRVNGTVASATTGGTAGTSTSAAFGIWCAHLVVAGNNKVLGTDVQWSAFVSIKDGLTGQTSQLSSSFAAVPAPSAIALLGLAGFASRRRRA
jgi:MYXO-CTERM domain-containing protein